MSKSELSKWADEGLNALNHADFDALERKRRLGHYRIVRDGEKPVKVYPGNAVNVAVE